MTHFLATVKVTKERLDRHQGNLDSALSEMFEPYNEGTKNREYLVFDDQTDKFRKEFDEGTREYFLTRDGSLICRYDREYWRIHGVKDDGMFGEKRAPEGTLFRKVPFKAIYTDFAEFCDNWHGLKLGSDGRVGYWSNPNAKWDWYTIGGRWTGFYPLKAEALRRLGKSGASDNSPRPGHGDIVKLADIDFEAVAVNTQARAEKFWGKYTDWLENSGKADSHEVRSWAMDVGFVHVVREALTREALSRFDLEEEVLEKKVVPWSTFISNEKDDRRSWSDVCLIPTKESFFKDYLHRFNVVSTFAVLDDQGWHAPGRMGMFAVDHSKSEDKEAYKRAFMERHLLSAAPTDTIVAVDCHI